MSQNLVVLDPWQIILQSIEPAYNKLKYFMEHGPSIVPVLKGKTITLEEKWPENNDLIGPMYDSSKLDKVVHEIVIELDRWDNVKRTAWDQWKFSTRKDAEKFITLFNLKWAE